MLNTARQIYTKMSLIGNCCTALGLTATSIVYVGYASDSSGNNFSLGTPLGGSTYVAFVSVLSTSAVPTASSFAGKWVKLFSSTVLQSNITPTGTATTTLTTLNTLTLPIGVWAIGDVIKTQHFLSCATPSTNSQAVSLLMSGNNLLSLTPNFNYNGAIATIQGILIETQISKITALTAGVSYTVKYLDATGVVSYEVSSLSSVIINNSDLATTPFLVKGQCANGADTITLLSATVILNRA